ncbi:glycoside hydrolase family 35 protein [Microbacterium sp. ASV49]|uniref:Beta-galactosidase n=1 Tax=Microbacterium candidum TaxID=3041922 RepID=A0ABT7MVB8_9MICO|nr:beta-galactosidase family protein [Microbacterium sp. ASV49]MDL9978394.1 beta-galactosidase [Microbacterium sp. ASV49]
MPSFSIGTDDFLLDGEPFQVISGALHYFRIHPDQWRDRLEKARLMGLNTIETYVAWNHHAPERGRFRTDRGLDLARFIDTAHELGLRVIVRPGPYICAEWYDGGLPSWLLAEPGIRLRSSDPAYLEAVEEYLAQVYEIVVPRQITAGGPVILVQIENEYGAYGSDAVYLRRLVEVTRAAGVVVPLTTVDQPLDDMLEYGSVEGAHLTASFGSRAVERLAALRRHQPTGPLMCSEFWCGWFDSWGDRHHVTTAEDAAAELDALLKAGASVNIYMFHGGTNFGFTAGANDKGMFRPIATSYDYDAPLAEDGSPTEKYWRFREVISRYAPVPDERPAERVPAPVLSAPLMRTAPLSAARPDAHPYDRLPDATAFGCLYPVTHYETVVARGGLLAFADVRDRAHVFLDGGPIGVIDRERGERTISIPRAGRVSLLVEQFGGVDYGPRLGEPKGLIGPVSIEGRELEDWTAGPVSVRPADLRAVLERAGDPIAPGGSVRGPAIATGAFELCADAVVDLHLDTAGWGSGAVWINGFALGRYSTRGPQHTLYVPAPVLRAGQNEVLVVEFAGIADAVVRFAAAPDLGPVDI